LPLVDRLADHDEAIRFQKIAGSKLGEVWFDGTVPINPGLVAIIGNKGSGKTALAEAIGLLGNCESADSFSFLNGSKFRQSKNNKAREFEAMLTWRNGHLVTRKLSDQTDPDMPRDVSYIPQSHLEAICNEVNNVLGSKFDSELKSVIFSHVLEHKKLNELDQALQDFARVTELDPGYCYAYHQRGLIHEVRGDVAAAKEAGLAHTAHIAGGIDAWKKAGGPVLTG